MNNPVKEIDNREVIEDEAGLWLAKIDGRELESEEVRELLAWMRRSDFHREYLLTLARQWDGMGVLDKLAVLFPLTEPEKKTEAAGGAGNRWLVPWLPAWSGLLAFSLVVVMVVLQPWGQSQQFYTTAVGETQRYLLSDGSTLTLNTNTHVLIDYNETRRKVTLIQGEANFDVAKNPDKPFMVYAGSGVVQAVGTAFNVRYTQSKAADDIVTEGRVSVIRQTAVSPTLPALNIRDQAPALLDAGQRIQYSEVSQPAEAVPIEEELLSRRLAWQSGSLIFKGETLEQAIAEISRYTDKKLIIADPSLRQLEVGGRYRTDNIDELLSSLAGVMDIDIQYLPGGSIQLSAKENSNNLKNK